MDASDEVFEQTWKALVSIPNLHMIHLKRVNVLETAISSKIAYQTGLYGNTGEKNIRNTHSYQSKDSKFSVVFPVDKLQALFEQTKLWEDDWPHRFSHCPQIDITYEELCLDPDRQLDHIASFLGLKYSPQWRTTFHKQRTQSIQSSLVNYHELKEYFSSTEWSRYFTE